MKIAIAAVLAVLALLGASLVESVTSDDDLTVNTATGYMTVGPCDTDELLCPAARKEGVETVCRLDCARVDSEGNHHDCIFHFYNKATREHYPRCWE